MIRSGDFHRQVTIQARSTTRDEYGGSSATWTDVATVMASLQPLSGRELELAKAFAAEVTTQINIRYRTNINAGMRIAYQGRFFNIHAVMDVDMRHEVLQLMTSEGLNAG